MALITCEKAAFAYEGRVVVDALDLTVERGRVPVHRGGKRVGQEHAGQGAAGADNACEGLRSLWRRPQAHRNRLFAAAHRRTK